MYLLYESMYGDLLFECDGTNIIGLFSTKEQAIKTAQKYIQDYITEQGFVLDDECDCFGKYNMVRLFYKEQENWSSYFEMIIKEMELE